jgi:hypothetical protein
VILLQDSDHIHNPIQRTLLIDLHEILLGLQGECKTDHDFDHFIKELKLFNNNDIGMIAQTVYEALRENDDF